MSTKRTGKSWTENADEIARLREANAELPGISNTKKLSRAASWFDRFCAGPADYRRRGVNVLNFINSRA